MRLFKSVTQTIVALTALICGASCTDPDYEMGADFLPDGNQIEIGTVKMIDGQENSSLFSVENYFVNDLATSDGSEPEVLITGGNISTGMLGHQEDSVFGSRRAGFFTQYTPAYTLDDEGFGADAEATTLTIYLTVSNYVGDTTEMQQFAIYDIYNDNFLRNSSDSIFRAENTKQMLIDGGAVDINEPIATFTFPDQSNGVYVGENISVIEVPFEELSQSGQNLINRLMLKEVDGYSQIDYKLYDDDYDEFLDYFYGLYIAPIEGGTLSNGEGATYGINIEYSLFGFTCKGLKSDDDEITTYGMSFSFNDPRIEDYGGYSIASVERENEITAESIATPDELRIEGMGGVTTQLTFEKKLFEDIYTKIEEAEEEYSSIFINSAVLRLYIAQGEDMNDMPSRLGMYTFYTNRYDDDGYYRVEPIEDYDYVTEIYYSTTSSYDGTLNRSHKCYEMNIELHLQEMWSEYIELKNSGEEIVWEDQTWNNVIVAPIITNVFSSRYARLSSLGADAATVELKQKTLSPLPTLDNEPISLQITYTLVK